MQGNAQGKYFICKHIPLTLYTVVLSFITTIIWLTIANLFMLFLVIALSTNQRFIWNVLGIDSCNFPYGFVYLYFKLVPPLIGRANGSGLLNDASFKISKL